MATTEHSTVVLHGLYRDVLRDPNGRVLWERGWNQNNHRAELSAFAR